MGTLSKLSFLQWRNTIYQGVLLQSVYGQLPPRSWSTIGCQYSPQSLSSAATRIHHELPPPSYKGCLISSWCQINLVLSHLQILMLCFSPWWSWRQESMQSRCWCPTPAARLWAPTLRSTSPCVPATPSETVSLRRGLSQAPVWESASSLSSSSWPVLPSYCVS